MYQFPEQSRSNLHIARPLRERLYEYVQMFFFLIVVFSISNLIISNWNEIRYVSPGSTIFRPLEQALGSFSTLLIAIGIFSVFLEIDIAGFKFQVMQQICDEVGYHRLSKEEILENENRQNIINAVYADPGIHYNKLLRICELQPGQLQWHLKILLEYAILDEERWGRYVMYYLKANLTSDQHERLKHPVLKAKTTRMVFRTIQRDPGIQPSSIAKKLDLNRNTIKYHTDKLKKYGLISTKKEGRSLLLFEKSITPYQT